MEKEGGGPPPQKDFQILGGGGPRPPHTCITIFTLFTCTYLIAFAAEGINRAAIGTNAPKKASASASLSLCAAR
ncbi:hypothetical protein MiSe_85040 [Microseira wollei NIES-4236]|uniref:Uncharacterized protein n=1 Tax=Microseira wollei NIES-4236 TaxID=2530354 RepID=A0AAV3XRX9_9CYAN|nr:hypothetical protein MiSe_85040 [Microseira wollei NIES-4236]